MVKAVLSTLGEIVFLINSFDAVLEIQPVDSPQTAVKISIVADLKRRNDLCYPLTDCFPWSRITLGYLL
jgi:hypothetical protein